ncbi:MAG: sulfite oxidase [bacterium]
MMNEFPKKLSRRSFLTSTGSAALLATGIGGPASSLFGNPKVAQEKDLELILRRARPLNLETPRAGLNSWLTPTHLFYVRNHYQNPDVVLADWQVSIGGEVDPPKALNFAAIRRLPKVTIIATTECTGNGRAYFQPKTKGNQWEVGAVGNAVWSGVRLSDLLKDFGIHSAGKFVTLKGGEKRPSDATPQFIRSIPIDKAMQEVILAYEMNGMPLTPDHGYPIRALVPGWYGASSVKWLVGINITREPDSGHYQQESYRIQHEGQDLKDAGYATVLNVKSIISTPGVSTVSAGRIPVQGVAWSGAGEIRRVEFSADSGKNWQDADLIGLQVPHAWQSWFYLWTARPGSYKLMSRATDSAGRVQPLRIAWNRKGYSNNAVADHAIEVTVV